MNLEQQVCSLELAKRLKELGVKQESLFAWSKPLRSMPAFIDYVNNLELRRGDCSAFTVAELGELITDQNDIAGLPYYHDWEWKCAPGYHIAEITEADARAAMLVYLIEKKLLAA
jgi:hypothetical protein